MTAPLHFAGSGLGSPAGNTGEVSKRAQKTHRKPQSDEPFEEKQRSCLMCGSKFQSKWSGERVCKRCKESAAWRAG